MADERHIIEIILKARDDTAAAFSEAIRNTKEFEKAQEQSAESAKRLEEDHRRATDSMVKDSTRLKQIREELGSTDEKILKAQVDLEDSYKRLTTARESEIRSSAREAQAIKEVDKATKDLSKALIEVKGHSKEVAETAAEVAREDLEIANNRRIAARRTVEAHKLEVASARDRQRELNKLHNQALADDRERTTHLKAEESKRKALSDEAIADQKRRNDLLVKADQEFISRRSRLHQAALDEDKARTEQRKKLAQEELGLLDAIAKSQERTAKSRDAYLKREIAAEDERLRAVKRNSDEMARERARIERDTATLARQYTVFDWGSEQARKATAQMGELRKSYRENMGEVRNLDRIQKESLRDHSAGLADIRKKTDDITRAAENLARVQSRRKDLTAKGEPIPAHLEVETEVASAKLVQFQQEAKALLRHIEAKVDLNDPALAGDIAKIEAAKALLSRAVKIEVKIDADRGISSLRRTARLVQGFQGAMSEGFHNMAGSVAAFDNVLRGLTALTITAFLANIVQVAGAAAGALFALGSSAIYAAGALGGALTAGLAQALPMLGLFATALSRVKAVTDAAQQAGLIEQQSGKQADTSARQQATANEALSKAVDKVTEARKNARAEIEKLILAEQRAVLSLGQAQDALQAAIRSGDTGGIASARLDVREARSNVRETRGDVREARTSGTEQQQSAQEQLKTAQRGATEAGTAVQASAAKLDFLMSKLSDSEKRLYTAILGLQEVWRRFAQEATAPLIDAFTKAIGGISKLLSDPGFVNLARGLAERMAGQLNRIFRVFTSPEIISRWASIIKQAEVSLQPFTTLLIRIGRIFLLIGDTAGPIFTQLIRHFASLAGDFESFLKKAERTGDLTKFFQEGMGHLRAWLSLLGSIGRVFLAIAGPAGGAAQGKSILESMTNAFNKFAKAVGTPGSGPNKFFKDLFEIMRQVGREIGPIFTAIGIQLARVFGQEAGNGGASIHGFSLVLTQVLIPAFGDFLVHLANAVRLVGAFIEKNPEIAKFAGSFVAFALFGSVLLRVSALFGPFIGGLNFIRKNLDDIGKVLSPVIKLFTNFRASFAANPFAIIIGAIVILLARFGQLDNILDHAKIGFQNLVERVEPPFNRLRASVKRLVDAFQGDGGLMPVLRVVAGVLAIVIGSVLVNGGRVLGNVLGAAIDIISGFVDVLTGILTLDPGLFVSGMKKIGEGILKGLTAPLRGIVDLLVDLFSDAIDALLDFLGIASPSKKFKDIGEDILRGIARGLIGLGRLFTLPFRLAVAGIRTILSTLPNVVTNAFNKVIDFLKKLPGRFAGFAKDAAGAFTKGFKDVGGDVLKAMFKGVTGAGEFAKSIVNGIIGLVERAINSVDKIGPVSVPDVHLPRLAKGGPVPGSGTGDTVHALLTPGEHVLTRSEVAAAGGHGAIFAMRRLLGGGSQAYGGGYLVGGVVKGDDKTADPAATKEALAEVSDLISRFGKQARAAWKDVWGDLRVITRNNLARIEERIKEDLGTILNLFKHRGTDMANSMRRTMQNVMRAAYTGLDYVGDATKASLQAFDARVPSIRVPRPRDLTRASGGWIGNQGERGRDQIRTVLGRGEAVLNWGQQKIVNSALWNQYGTTLDGVFKSTRGYHAGGQEDAVGFAQGGLTGPHGTGAAFTPITNFAMRKFGLQMTAGRTDHNYTTSSGNVSDHSWGGAGDFSNGSAPTPGMDGFSNFWLQRAPQVIKQLIWRNQDQQRGFPVDGHMDHVHLAIQRALAFDSSRMAKIISRASRGLSIAELMAGGAGIDVDHVAKIVAKGAGSLGELVQKGISKARKAANKFIDKIANRFAPGVAGANHAPYDGPLNHRFPAHGAGEGGVQLSPEQVMEVARAAGLPARLFEQIAHGESNYFPGVISSDGGYGLWQMTPRVWGAEGIAQMNKLGGVNAMLNPYKNALMAKYLYDQAGQQITPWYGTGFVTGRATGGYAGSFDRGGEIKGPHKGEPMAATVHVGEWVLNPQQQGRLATIMGTSTDAIKRILGFTGGAKNSFDEGGDIVAGPRFQRQQARRGVFDPSDLVLEDFGDMLREARFAQRALNNMNRKAKNFYGQFNTTMNALTKEGGIFDQMSEEIERFSQALATRLATRTFGLRSTRVRGETLRDRGPAAIRVPGFDESVQQRLTPSQVAVAEQRNLRRVNRLIQAERVDVARSQTQVDRDTPAARRAMLRARNALNEGKATKEEKEDYNKLKDRYQDLVAQRVNLRKRRQELDQQLADNLAARFQASEDAMQRVIDKAGKPSENFQRSIGVLNTLGLGGSNAAFFLGEANIAAMKEQARVIKILAVRARQTGHKEFADTLDAQFKDLNASITEAVANLMQARVDAVEARASRQEAHLTRFGRIGTAANLLTGNTVGAARVNEGILSGQRQNLIQQRAELQRLIPAAFASGNVGLTQAIQDKIAELGAQLAENTLALKDAATATRQAMIDQIASRASFRTGTFGSIVQFLQAISTRTGADTTAQQEGLIQKSVDALNVALTGFLDQLFKIFGVDLRGLSGVDLVTAISKLDFDKITANMSVADKQQFENLVGAILGNTLETEQNTAALEQTVNKTPQSFSSTGWQWFREALFTGMGDPLPQYVPPMETGGFVTKTGVFQLHAGEFVVNPQRSNVRANEGDTHITVNEAGGPLDVTYLANRLAFARKTSK